MRFWPIFPVVSAFCLGAFTAKKDPQDRSREAMVVPKLGETSLLAGRTRGKEDPGLMPANVLENVLFQGVVAGKVTPVARHLLDLTDAQCAAVEAAMAERAVAIQALDQKLGLEATIVEETDEQTVINLPDDPEARHAIEMREWQCVHQAVGKTKAKGLRYEMPEFNPSHQLERVLTLKHKEGSVETIRATKMDGRRFNSNRSVSYGASLSPLWQDIVERLGAE